MANVTLLPWVRQGPPGTIGAVDTLSSTQPAVIDLHAVLNINGAPLVQKLLRLRGQITLLGHAFEALNYGLLPRLFTLTPDQKQRVQAGEQALYGYLVKMRGMDLEAFKRWNSKIVSDVIIALGHAARGMKLLTAENPDLLAKN